MCAHSCSEEKECKSYEFYDTNCKLSKEKHPTRHKSSGFIHCSKIGRFIVDRIIFLMNLMRMEPITIVLSYYFLNFRSTNINNEQ